MGTKLFVLFCATSALFAQTKLPPHALKAAVTNAIAGGTLHRPGEKERLQFTFGLAYGPGSQRTATLPRDSMHTGLFTVVREIKGQISLGGEVIYFTLPPNSTIRKPVPTCTVAVNSNFAKTLTDVRGNFSFKNLPTQKDYRININRKALALLPLQPPVTIADLQALIVLIDSLRNCPRRCPKIPRMQALAADLNEDERIDSLDSLALVNFFMEKRPAGQIGTWRFSPADTCVPVNDQPITGLRIQAAMVGDVNASWCATPASCSDNEANFEKIQKNLEPQNFVLASGDTFRLFLPFAPDTVVSAMMMKANFDSNHVRFLSARVCKTTTECPGLSQALWARPGDLRFFWALTKPTRVAHAGIELVFQAQGNTGQVTEISFSEFWTKDKNRPLPKYQIRFAEEINLPTQYALWQNYPNPFNPKTVIRYEIPLQGYEMVQLAIFDLQGRLVKTLVEQVQRPGRFRVEWDGILEQGQPAASGTYFYRLRTEKFEKTRKLLLLR